MVKLAERRCWCWCRCLYLQQSEGEMTSSPLCLGHSHSEPSPGSSLWTRLRVCNPRIDPWEDLQERGRWFPGEPGTSWRMWTSHHQTPSQCLTAGRDWQPAASTNQITIFRAGYCSLYTTDTDTDWVISLREKSPTHRCSRVPSDCGRRWLVVCSLPPLSQQPCVVTGSSS